MPIFGSRDIFGRSRFGQANFGEIALYGLLPRVHRVLDEENGSPVRKLFKAFEEEMEDLRRQIDFMPFQRDPYLADGLNYPLVLRVMSAQPDAQNESVVITLDRDHDFTGVDHIDILGTTNDTLEGRFEVLEVIDNLSVRINADPNLNLNDAVGALTQREASNSCLVEILDVIPFVGEWGDRRRPLVKVIVSNKSNLSKLGLGFVATVSAKMPVPPPENAFIDPDRALYKVLYANRRDQALGGDIEIICDGGVRLEDLTGELPSRLVIPFVKPSTLALLANDYGLVNDDNLPDTFQRTEVANVYQFLRLKSSRKAYEARSAGGGFEVTVTQLFRLCESVIENTPEQHVFIGTTGDGNEQLYTDLQVLRPRYDDLSADVTLPDGTPITDVVLYRDSSSLLFNDAVDSYFNCLFEVTVDQIIHHPNPEDYEALGFNLPVYEVRVSVPNGHGWEVGTFQNGSFSLTDSQGNDYFIEGSDDNNRLTQPVAGLYLDAPNLFFSVGDVLCLAYRPDPDDIQCCPCPSAEIMITIEALPAFLNKSGYSGEALTAAVKRILTRLKREQVPIHVHTAIERLVISIDVAVPETLVDNVSVGLEVEAINVGFEDGQDYDCRFDDTPADVEVLDTCAMVLSYPGVTLEISTDPPVASGQTVSVTLDPFVAPTVEVSIETGVFIDIIITGSSFFDDIPADDIQTDDVSVGLNPDVDVQVVAP